MTKHDKEILGGIPRGVWADTWATEQEEKGHSFSGQEITSIAPKTPAWAKKWAQKIADEIVKLNNRSLDSLYEEVVACGYPHDKDQFGLHLGMQTAGHGISWEDDIPYGRCSLEIKLPQREFYR